MNLDFSDIRFLKTCEEQLRRLGLEEVPESEQSASRFQLDFEHSTSGFIQPAGTPYEKAFKLAGLRLFLEGRYPSARAIKQELLGEKFVSKKRVNLNGRECRWKSELFHTLGIEPFWWKKMYREDYRYVDENWLPRWRRGPKGMLKPILYREVTNAIQSNQEHAVS